MLTGLSTALGTWCAKQIGDARARERTRACVHTLHTECTVCAGGLGREGSSASTSFPPSALGRDALLPYVRVCSALGCRVRGRIFAARPQSDLFRCQPKTTTDLKEADRVGLAERLYALPCRRGCRSSITKGTEQKLSLSKFYFQKKSLPRAEGFLLCRMWWYAHMYVDA